MTHIEVKPAENDKEIRDFINLPWQIYNNKDAWVPPLKSDFKKYILGLTNSMNQSGPNIRLLAYNNYKPAARLIVGINEHLNELKGYREGYISLFESIDDINVSNTILTIAEKWLKEKGMDTIIGPLSLPGGEDNRGFIIDNFKDPTMVMGSYNKPYYNTLFTHFGFEKYQDCYAYTMRFDRQINERYMRLVPYAKKKYKFDLHKLDMKNISKEMEDIKTIIYEAMPEEWADFVPPTDEEIQIIADSLIPIADPNLIYIARLIDGRPIGFNLTLPDYNQVLKKMNGRLFPTGIIKYLYYKKKIDRARFFVLFVVPEYRKKGVPSAIYIESFNAARANGYIYGEGSTIWEYNKIMMRDIETFGGEKYKTYRIYKKNILSDD
ncbi:MAG: Uncharacterized protein XD91_1338 [Clostridiales bacterium 38_11]|nr:MAG: Uncharacterized protein XD91_1338 [Clostridiales bacterium 38_11]HBH13262.1 hypothetical protein [Clostridiales bacterium]